MSHVDEGQLHEYLDRWGEASPDRSTEDSEDRVAIEAHLAGCTACRALLGEVREVRDRAASLLAVASPPPGRQLSFADVLARAGRSEQRRRLARINRLTAVGWAATVVLAAGIGWIARGAAGVDQHDAPPVGVVAQRVSPPSATGAEPDVADDVTASLDGTVEATQPTGRSDAASKGPAVAGEREDRGVSNQAEPATRPARLEEQAHRAAPAPAAEIPPSTRQPAAPSALKVATEAGVRTQVAREGQAGAARLVPAGSAAGADAGWTHADSAEATALLGQAMRAVPGLPILTIERGSVNHVPAIRVTQQAGDAVVWIVQLSSGSQPQPRAAADELAALGGVGADTLTASATPIVLQRDGVILLLGGSVAPDSLALLAQRIP